jgi:ubiquinone/menaquinone biosynthesis C-methylase UbiE
MIKTEWQKAPEINIDHKTISREQINKLYELRSQVLDWELETGFLGFFTANPGYRYAFTRRLEVLFELLPELREKRVLEIGCAAGILANALAPYVREYVGIDVTPTAIQFARTLSRQLRQFNTRFIVADAHELPFPAASFDLLITTETYEHLIEPMRALREFHRVLRPGGHIVITTPTAPNLSDFCMRLLHFFKRDIYLEEEAQFDKKAYFSAKRAGKSLPPAAFQRVHFRFSYRKLTADFENVGFCILRSKGAVFSLPPYVFATYSILPSPLLPLIRHLEELLNKIHLFPRWGSFTTGFLLEKRTP